MAERTINERFQDLIDERKALYKRNNWHWPTPSEAAEAVQQYLEEYRSRQAKQPCVKLDDDYSQIDDESSCDESYCDDCSSIDEPTYEPTYEPSYEPLRRYTELSIRRQNKLSNRTQYKLPFKPPFLTSSQADDVAVDTSCDSITQGVVFAVDELTSTSWHRDVFTYVDRWKHRAGKQHNDDILG
jgi:hypothetical protein